MRAWCKGNRYFPNPLGNVTAAKNIIDSTGAAAPKAPSDEGKRSAVAVVNGCPVDSQSRDRARRSELSAEEADWGRDSS